MIISDIMKTELVTISPDGQAQEASEKMYRFNIRHLPVVEESAVKGILSDRDLALAATFDKDDQRLGNLWKEGVKVRDLMTEAPVTVSPQDSVERVMEMAVRDKLGAFMVLDKGKLVGIVSTIDLLQIGLKALKGEI